MESVESMRFCYLLILLLLGLSLTKLNAQSLEEKALYTRAADSLELSSLRQNYGISKIIPAEIELQALRALSHYPELTATKIRFKWYKSKTAHSSRPDFRTILRKRTKRTYVICISTEVPDFYFPGMQAQLPYNAQVGVLGHELGHTAKYLQTRFWGLLATGVRYSLSGKFVIATEHETDQTTIAHGLGWQLLAWSKIAHPLLEQAGRGQNYLLPAEIEAVLSAEEGK